MRRSAIFSAHPCRRSMKEASMPVSDYQMVDAWTQVLKLSRLEAGQTVTILTSASTHPQTLSTALIATQSMGAIVNRLDLPPVNGEKALSRDSLAYLGSTPLTGNRAAIAALKESDLVLDLMTLLFSPEQLDILKTGTKILLAVEPPEVLTRLVPTPADRERVLAAQARIARAKEMHIVSAAGTDFHCPLGEFEPIAEYGFVDEPGRWDHWPSGFALTFPNDGKAHGRIVIDRGDILLPQKSYAQERIELTVEGGYATRIEGGVDAQLLSEYMATFNDPEAYAISHIARTGRRSDCTTARRPSAWMRVPSKATSCFRSARTTKQAAAARRPAISTFRCVIAMSFSTANPSCAMAWFSIAND
jgi:2,5-dihydroxypyridine 5,6-dioxygenase